MGLLSSSVKTVNTIFSVLKYPSLASITFKVLQLHFISSFVDYGDFSAFCGECDVSHFHFAHLPPYLNLIRCILHNFCRLLHAFVLYVNLVQGPLRTKNYLFLAITFLPFVFRKVTIGFKIAPKYIVLLDKQVHVSLFQTTLILALEASQSLSLCVQNMVEYFWRR